MEEQTIVRYVENLAISILVSSGFVHQSVETRNLEDEDTQTKFSGHLYYLTVKEFMISLLVILLKNYWNGMICNN